MVGCCLGDCSKILHDSKHVVDFYNEESKSIFGGRGFGQKEGDNLVETCALVSIVLKVHG